MTYEVPTLTREDFEGLEYDVAVGILRARFDALVDDGCEPEVAATFAVHTEIDLAKAAELLRSGCPPRTALCILR